MNTLRVDVRREKLYGMALSCSFFPVFGGVVYPFSISLRLLLSDPYLNLYLEVNHTMLTTHWTDQF